MRLCTLIACVFVATASAQEISTGPDKEKPVPALKVHDVTGINMGKEIDYAAERKDKPTIYLMINAQKFDRPMAQYLRKLDEALQKDTSDSYAVAVWLTDTAEKTKEYLPIAQRSLDFQKTALAYYSGDLTGPKDWNINTDAHLTTVIVVQGKVAAVFGYRSLNATDVPAVKEAFEKALGKK